MGVLHERAQVGGRWPQPWTRGSGGPAPRSALCSEWEPWTRHSLCLICETGRMIQNDRVWAIVELILRQQAGGLGRDRGSVGGGRAGPFSAACRPSASVPTACQSQPAACAGS